MSSTENALQRAVVKHLRFRGLNFRCSLEGWKRTKLEGSQLKQLGMEAGFPDIEIYLPGGEILFIELKTKKNSLSPKQKARHERLRADGFHDIHVVKASDTFDMVQQVKAIIDVKLGQTGHQGTL